MINKLVSGAQSGADWAGILAAYSLGIRTAGFMPLGWRTEDGPRPDAEEFGLTQWLTSDYIDRTRANVAMSDGTVIFGRRSPGSNRTEEECGKQGRPVIWIDVISCSGEATVRVPVIVLKDWIRKHGIKTINIAGNRESVTPGIQAAVTEYLMEALSE